MPTDLAPSLPVAPAQTAAPALVETSPASDAFFSTLAELLAAETPLSAAQPPVAPIMEEEPATNIEQSELGALLDAPSPNPIEPQLPLDRQLHMIVCGATPPEPQALQERSSAIESLLKGASLSVAAQLATARSEASASEGAQLANGVERVDARAEGKPALESAFINVALLTAQERTAQLREHGVRAHVGTPRWTDEIAGRLTTMVGNGIQNASLQLAPEHLGPLEVRITIRNDETSVWFGAAHAETRAALEQALPRLRELLAGQGLNLTDAGVFRDTPKHAGKFANASAFNTAESERETIAIRAPRGIVDAYA